MWTCVEFQLPLMGLMLSDHIKGLSDLILKGSLIPRHLDSEPESPVLIVAHPEPE